MEKENAAADQLRIDIGRDRLLLNRAVETGDQKEQGRALASLSRDQAALDTMIRGEQERDHEYYLRMRESPQPGVTVSAPTKLLSK